MTFKLKPAALGAAFLVALAASAQVPPPPGAPIDEAAAVASGRVKQWLVNPGGQVDGLLLSDGTQVAFAPDAPPELLQAVKPGDTVKINGRRSSSAPVVQALDVTAGGRTLAVSPPQPRERASATPPVPRQPAALTAMTARGQVVAVLYTPRGDANGVVLDSGTVVRYPPHVGASLADMTRPGSRLSARGWGSRSPQGSALEATALGATDASMKELFATPGQEAGGPPQAMRPPRGPAGPEGARPVPPGPAAPDVPPPPAS